MDTVCSHIVQKGGEAEVCVSSGYLWNVDAGPEELQVLPHLLRLEFGVEDGQLCEHAHVSALQAEGGLQHGDQLLKVAAVLQGRRAAGGGGLRGETDWKSEKETSSMKHHPTMAVVPDSS